MVSEVSPSSRPTIVHGEEKKMELKEAMSSWGQGGLFPRAGFCAPLESRWMHIREKRLEKKGL